MSIHYHNYVFREARTFSELESLFRLRYEGYLESSCASLVNINPLGMEVDAFDWNSVHFGLFLEGRTYTKALAYSRVTQDQPSRHAPMVSQLVARNDGIEIPEPAPASYPMLVSCGQQEEIEGHLLPFRESGMKVVEAGRLVLAPEIRQSGFHKFFIEASMASTFYRVNADVISLACHPNHTAIYRRYGFEIIIDGRKNDYNGLKASVVTLAKKDLHPRRAEGIKSMGDIMQKTGAILLPSTQVKTPVRTQKNTQLQLA